MLLLLVADIFLAAAMATVAAASASSSPPPQVHTVRDWSEGPHHARSITPTHLTHPQFAFLPAPPSTSLRPSSRSRSSRSGGVVRIRMLLAYPRDVRSRLKVVSDVIGPLARRTQWPPLRHNTNGGIGLDGR